MAKIKNKDYDNFGFHWYPKQSSSSYGAMFGLTMTGLGILLLVIQVIFFNIAGIFFSIIMIFGGRIIAGHFALKIENEKNR